MDKIFALIFSIILLASFSSALTMDTELISFEHFKNHKSETLETQFIIPGYETHPYNSIPEGQGFFVSNTITPQTGDFNIPITKVKIYLHSYQNFRLPAINQSFLDELKPGIYTQSEFQTLNPYHNNVAVMFPNFWKIDGIWCEISVNNPSNFDKCKRPTNPFVSRVWASSYPQTNSLPIQGGLTYEQETLQFNNAVGTINGRIKEQYIFYNGFFYVPGMGPIAMLMYPGRYRMYTVAEVDNGNYYLVSNQVDFNITVIN